MSDYFSDIPIEKKAKPSKAVASPDYFSDIPIEKKAPPKAPPKKPDAKKFVPVPTIPPPAAKPPAAPPPATVLAPKAPPAAPRPQLAQPHMPPRTPTPKGAWPPPPVARPGLPPGFGLRPGRQQLQDPEFHVPTAPIHPGAQRAAPQAPESPMARYLRQSWEQLSRIYPELPAQIGGNIGQEFERGQNIAQQGVEDIKAGRVVSGVAKAIQGTLGEGMSWATGVFNTMGENVDPGLYELVPGHEGTVEAMERARVQNVTKQIVEQSKKDVAEGGAKFKEEVGKGDTAAALQTRIDMLQDSKLELHARARAGEDVFKKLSDVDEQIEALKKRQAIQAAPTGLKGPKVIEGEAEAPHEEVERAAREAVRRALEGGPDKTTVTAADARTLTPAEIDAMKKKVADAEGEPPPPVTSDHQDVPPAAKPSEPSPPAAKPPEPKAPGPTSAPGAVPFDTTGLSPAVKKTLGYAITGGGKYVGKNADGSVMVRAPSSGKLSLIKPDGTIKYLPADVAKQLDHFLTSGAKYTGLSADGNPMAKQYGIDFHFMPDGSVKTANELKEEAAKAAAPPDTTGLGSDTKKTLDETIASGGKFVAKNADGSVTVRTADGKLGKIDAEDGAFKPFPAKMGKTLAAELKKGGTYGGLTNSGWPTFKDASGQLHDIYLDGSTSPSTGIDLIKPPDKGVPSTLKAKKLPKVGAKLGEYTTLNEDQEKTIKQAIKDGGKYIGVGEQSGYPMFENAVGEQFVVDASGDYEKAKNYKVHPSTQDYKIPPEPSLVTKAKTAVAAKKAAGPKVPKAGTFQPKAETTLKHAIAAGSKYVGKTEAGSPIVETKSGEQYKILSDGTYAEHTPTTTKAGKSLVKDVTHPDPKIDKMLKAGNNFVADALGKEPKTLLPVDDASRKARAKAMGFNPDLVFYHGLRTDSKGNLEAEFAFHPEKKKSEPAVFVTNKPSIAAQYAHSGTMLRLWGKMENPLVVNWPDVNHGMQFYDGASMSKLIKKAIADGHDVVVINNISDLGGKQTQWAFLKPEHLRAADAAVFDPAKSKSAHLLSASVPPKGTAPPVHPPSTGAPGAGAPPVHVPGHGPAATAVPPAVHPPTGGPPTGGPPTGGPPTGGPPHAPAGTIGTGAPGPVLGGKEPLPENAPKGWIHEQWDKLHQHDRTGDADKLEILQAARALPKAAVALKEKFFKFFEPGGKKPTLTPEEQALLDEHLKPWKEEERALYEEIKKIEPGLLPDDFDPDYIRHMVKGKTPEIDVPLGDKAREEHAPWLNAKLPQTSSSLKNSQYYVIDNGKGVRQVVMLDRKGNIYRMQGKKPISAPDITLPKGETEMKPGGTVHASGQSWKIARASVEEKERETNLQYHKDAFAATYANVVQLRKVARAVKWFENLKDSDEWLEYATRIGGNKPIPKGWREPKMPMFRGWAVDPHLADLIDQYHGSYGFFHDSLEDGLAKINHTVLGFLFWQPVTHGVNVAAHWAVGRGWDWLNVPQWANFARDLTTAVRDVTQQGPITQALLKEGSAQMLARNLNRDFYAKVLTALGENLKKNPQNYAEMFKAIGVKPAEFAKWWMKKSNESLWWINDVFMTQRVLELKRKGLSTSQAIREAEKHIPNYRVPPRVMNSSIISRYLGSSAASQFGRFHYGMWKSNGFIVRDLVKGTKKERIDALGHAMVLGVLGMVAGPAISYGIAQLTGDDRDRMAARGPFGGINDVKDLLTMWLPQVTERIGMSPSERSFSQVLQSALALSPGIAQVLGFVTGQNIYTRQPVETFGERAQAIADAFLPSQITSDLLSGRMTELEEFIKNTIGISRPKPPMSLRGKEAEEWKHSKALRNEPINQLFTWLGQFIPR